MHATLDPLARAFRDEVLAGLAAPVPAIPSRWFYDARGAELFEAITKLPSYYPTRVETALLGSMGPDLSQHVPSGAALIEFGSGSATKTPVVIEAVRASAYVPVDISTEYLSASTRHIGERFPDLPVHPIGADFAEPFSLPADIGAPRLGFFPGSTIGNFVPQSATDLLRHFRSLLGTGAQLLIGMDLVKDVARLLAAYDEPEGVTARFNLNLLERINRELDGDIPVDAFVHDVRWNDIHSRIEMHLVATRSVEFEVAGRRFAFPEGSAIHTENSHKYSRRSARLLLLAGGWTPIAEWTDPAGDFLETLAVAEPDRFAP